jgi:hypothetical protein
MEQSYSQTPPPTPPNVNAGYNNGITHSEAETRTSYAFSCAFTTKHYPEILKLINEGGHNFTEDFYVKNEQHEIKIELKKTELKIEYKSFSGQASEEKERLKSIASKIIKL